ncbi:MAG: CoB--CoM heterodisulfide reductase iron-sulfur subunit B family protein [Desulfovibrionaceae bacterium]|nr:CoB--CoM heterodisulfide reductase iron-sulfur subunit B family protein [Desulfovibrionaceae bacterium]
MRYAYYPGCSLTESAVEFDVSTRALMTALGAELEEVPDWTCCGASAVEAVSRLLTYALPARNLALSERDLPGLDMLIPCSACYLNHLRVEREVLGEKGLRGEMDEILAADGLKYEGTVKVRHLLDVLTNDIELKAVKEKVGHALRGMVLAPYYGCQILRPYKVFDDPERPKTMDPLIKATGAEPLDWSMGSKCCGASLMATKKEVALESVAAILAAAKDADAIVTVCPMCQMNLEAYQKQALRVNGRARPISIVYLPQVLGLAFGLSEKDVLLDKNMTVTERFLNRLRNPEPPEEPEAKDAPAAEKPAKSQGKTEPAREQGTPAQ